LSFELTDFVNGPICAPIPAERAAANSRNQVDHGKTTNGSARSRFKNSALASPSQRSRVATPSPEARALTSATIGAASRPKT
jgi:hypothetical protein